MIFHFLGRFVVRTWRLLLAFWIVLLLVLWWIAPPWERFARDQEFAFLPEDAPSRRAEEVYARAFPEDKSESNIVLVLSRANSSKATQEIDRKYIADVLEPALVKIAEEQGGLASEPAPSEDESLFADSGPTPERPKRRSDIARIRTPNGLGYGPLLVSPDGQAMLVVVELTRDFLARGNWPTIAKVENLVRDLKQEGKRPAGLDIAVTGSAVIGRDRIEAQVASARATETLTVLLVVLLLVFIYRAPLLALIPLATVVLAVQVALRLLPLLAEAGLVTIFEGVQIYVTILAYGAGVDFCLFLTARYKEEMDRGANAETALATAIGGVGGAIVASTATVALGIAMMLFAQFGKFREAGIAIPLSLVLVLAATLTFTPSLLRLAGRWAFWPQRPGTPGPDAAPPPQAGWFSPHGAVGRAWDRVGHVLLRRPSTTWLVTVGLMAPFAVAAVLLYDRLSYDMISDLPDDAPSVVGTRVLQEHFPPGLLGPATVLVVDKQMDFHTSEGRALAERITESLRDRRQELGLADVRSLTAPLGFRPPKPQVPPGMPEEAQKEVLDRIAREYYTTSLGERRQVGTRLELILDNSPFARDSFERLDRAEHVIREAIPPNAEAQSQVYVLGTTASVRDLAAVIAGDRTRIEILVLASVFAILVILLRRLVVPIYLLASVLFSYYATLGVAFAVFWMLDPTGFRGIDWKVAVFLFTILIAVGEDYNIFLITRVQEEEKRFGPVRGVTEALTRTGPIISSCGVIMAGTFGSLMAGHLNEMKQLGFALAFGVLLDTFVVRPILVPAFLLLLAERQFPLAPWFGRTERAEKNSSTEAVPQSGAGPVGRG